MCNVKEVAHTDEPTEMYHLTIQFPQKIVFVYFSSLLWFSGPQLTCFDSLSSASFSDATGSYTLRVLDQMIDRHI